MSSLVEQCGLAVLALLTPGFLAPALAQDRPPLPRGYYVNSDTACGSASSETITLWHGDGFNIDNVSCSFTKLTDEGDRTWGFQQRCKYLVDGSSFTEVGQIEILGAEKMWMILGDWEGEMRLCPQAKLPKPWRTTDIPGS